VLAVRIQEVFGLIDTPRIAGSRVPVLLHLLGPNYRPQQVTDELRMFLDEHLSAGAQGTAGTLSQARLAG
jgi:hypothetical protein